MCYARRPYYGNGKTAAKQSNIQDTNRDELVANLLKQADNKGRQEYSARPSQKEPSPAK